MLTKTIGGVMSGSRSTRSWLYEKMPRTHSAAITIVAKTGFAIETRVNHMARKRRGYERGTGAADADADGDVDPTAGADAASPLRRPTMRAGAPSFRLSKRIASNWTSSARPLTISTRPDA